MSFNPQAGLITSLKVTPGSAYDGHQLPGLVEQDLAQDIGVEVYSGDRGYDDGENHLYLQSRGLKSALRLNAYRTQKKNDHKEPWLHLQADPDYLLWLRVRPQVERPFGEAKRCHGFGRCCYLGLVRYAVQGYLTATVLNLKRLVRFLFGVGFRQEPSPLLHAA